MKRFLILAAALLMSPFASAEGVLDDVVDRGALRVGFSSFVPWAMRDKQGEFVGFEIDVARELAKDMGVELELVPTSWDGIIPALLGKKFDLIIGGMTITPARNLQINFSAPYSRSGLGVVANRELAAGFDDLADFDSGEVTFALRRGATPVNFVQTMLPRANIVQFDDDASARQEVINGRAHAWVASEPEPTFSALDYPETLFRPMDEKFAGGSEGIGLRKGDADALNFLNNWVRTKQDSGWLAARHAYWFGGREWKAMVE